MQNNLDLETLSQEQLTDKVEELSLKYIKACQDNFLIFVKEMWPDFIFRKTGIKEDFGHHQIIANEFHKIAFGDLKRLIINMPPRHTKSEFASYLFPAWLIGRNPKLKIMQVTHNAELAQRFGRKVRNLVDSAEYKAIFGDVKLKEDSKAAGRWETNHGGEYFAAGVDGSITGRGADLLIIDDPHTEQALLSETSFEKTYDWYLSGPRQRLQPGGSIVIVMTRWSQNDLTSKLIKAQAEPRADQWRVVEFPAVLKSGQPVWPEYWSLEDLLKTKASISPINWNAQYMQNPTAEEGAIIKRDWWKPWKKSYLPEIQHVIQSYDTAFSAKESADYSAITTWGIFYPSEGYGSAIILLDAVKERLEFPELKQVALQQYKYWEPETVVIEAKASGQPLIQELRRLGIPVIDFQPSRGRDKHSRVNAVAPLFAAGSVWYPDGENFALEVIEECAAFPYGENDDLVDSMTQALLRYRQGGFINTPSDYQDEPVSHKDVKFYD
jgi:predicted phage terminase large subunit-like protein